MHTRPLRTTCRQPALAADRRRAQAERLVDVTAQLAAAHEDTIQRLSRAMLYRDPATGRHLEHMSRLSALIAGAMSLDPHPMKVASSMHDIGKIGVPESIMLKPGALTPAERLVMRGHAQIGHDLLCDSPSDLLGLAAAIAWTHHERYDGGGYPHGLLGEEIPLEGRIAAVADVFDALTSTRPYRVALPAEDALAMMDAESGLHFDPAVLEAFYSVTSELQVGRRFRRAAVPGPARPCPAAPPGRTASPGRPNAAAVRRPGPYSRT